MPATIPQWICTLDLVFGSGMFMPGALLAVMAVGWVSGAALVKQQFNTGLSHFQQGWMDWRIHIVVPAALAAILGGS